MVFEELDIVVFVVVVVFVVGGGFSPQRDSLVFYSAFACGQVTEFENGPLGNVKLTIWCLLLFNFLMFIMHFVNFVMNQKVSRFF
jgi:hypothetical protein